MKGQEKFMRKKAAEIMAIKNEDAAISGGMGALVAVGIGALILAVVFTIAPMIGSEVETATDIPADSQWNSSVNTDIPTGVSVWEKTKIIPVAVIIIVVSIFFAYLRGMFSSRGEPFHLSYLSIFIGDGS